MILSSTTIAENHIKKETSKIVNNVSYHFHEKKRKWLNIMLEQSQYFLNNAASFSRTHSRFYDDLLILSEFFARIKNKNYSCANSDFKIFNSRGYVKKISHFRNC